MRKTEEYLIAAYGPDPPAVTVEKIFDLVWLFDFTALGFCLLDPNPLGGCTRPRSSTP